MLNVGYTYGYYPSGLRRTKTGRNAATNAVISTNTYVWDGNNLVKDNSDAYRYGLSAISRNNKYYLHDAHGSVVGIANTSGSISKTYAYDAFGVELSPVSSDANPFRYSGEYFDAESGDYYLRARYSAPGLGRFLSEDPVRDGSNWYVYCNNNPVRFIDSFGLSPVAIRDYTEGYAGAVEWDERLGVATFKLNDNVFYSTGSGYNLEGFTVSNINGKLYAEDSDLNYFYFGITPSDTEAGVKISMYDGKAYIDISDPVSNSLDSNYINFKSLSGNYWKFAELVGNEGPWNLKYRDENDLKNPFHWENALGITFWGYQTKMLLNGRLVTVEQVGNITYGYIATVAGIDRFLMRAGPAVNHFLGHFIFAWDNEFADQALFTLGENWYRTGVMQ